MQSNGAKAVARVPKDVAEALHDLADDEGLFGRSAGAMERLNRRELNPWLREMGVEGSHCRFRAHQIQATRTSTKTTEGFYAQRAPEVPMVDWQTSEVSA